MKNDYEIIHYGHEDSEVECAEHVKVTTNDDLLKAYGTYDWKKEFFKHNTGDHAHQTFYRKTETELNKRMQGGDAILCFWGNGHQVVADKFKEKCFIIEPGIGYDAGSTFAPHKSPQFELATNELAEVQRISPFRIPHHERKPDPNLNPI